MSENAEEQPKPKKKRSILSIVTPEEAGIIEDRPEPRVWGMLAMMGVGKGDDRRYIPMNTPLNLRIIFTQDTRWAGKVRLNEFDGSTYVEIPNGPGPEPIGPTTATAVVVWLERVYVLRTTEDRVGRSLNEAANDYPYHPVREHLRSLVWDGRLRVQNMLIDYFGAAPNELHRELSMRWLISAVARVMRPGCKVDTTLILVGSQGALKSTGVKILATEPSWFSDTPLEIGSKDLYELIHGIWLYELAELDSFSKADWPKIKAILSSPRDRYRRPYSPAAEARERQCVFVGTTNDDHFLGDPTGSRRFWPVRCGAEVDLKGIERDRSQLWAEAVALFDKGERWWLDKAQATALAKASDEFQQRHPWFDLILDWSRGKDGFTLAEVLTAAVRKEPGHWNPADSKTAGGILRQLGFTSKAARVDGAQARIWVRAPE